MSESAWKGYPPIEERDAEIERLREENDALKIRIGTYYAGNANGGIVKQLESEIEQLRKERDSAFETWKAMHVATLNGFIKQHHEPLKTEIEQLRSELDACGACMKRADAEIERLKKRIRDLETERRHLRVALKEG